MPNFMISSQSAHYIDLFHRLYGMFGMFNSMVKPYAADYYVDTMLV